MGQALYRKYRPKKLADIVGQEHITDTLQHALEQNKISHAYLFTGLRGVGKTSVARILAHEINGLPYDDDSTHLDIIEIDAASNRRIDEIRELRDKIYIAPAEAKYKVYIIDEVHMLTREAFNALLKTLEEPPAHAVFILATTDAHKVPETIVSRTQRFTFKPVDLEKVAAHLSNIAQQEGITVSPEALSLLAESGEGSFRDSISMLDQLGSSGQPITLAGTQRLLGVPPAEAINMLAGQLWSGTAGDMVRTLDGLSLEGFQSQVIAKHLSAVLRQQLLNGSAGLPVRSTLDLLSELLKVPSAHDPERFLEIALLGASTASGQDVQSAAGPAVKTKVVVARKKDSPSTPIADIPTEATNSAFDGELHTDTKPELEEELQATGNADFNDSLWPQFLQALKQKYNTLYAVVRMAQPAFIAENGEKTLQLAFAFAFHEKRVKDTANRQKLAAIMYALTGETIAVTCVHDTSAKPSKATAEALSAPSSPEVAAISNIFGTAELLES